MRLPHMIVALGVFAMHAALATPPIDPAQLKFPRPGFIAGYLAEGSWVDSLALLPPPPAAGSAAQAVDDAAFQSARKLKDGPRWALAASDAVLVFPKAAESFQCALGIPISAESTPNLNMLLRRTLTDAGFATFKAKDFYKRLRPFAANNETMCTPHEEASLRKSASYPSGHSAIGWTWGLVLAEVAPERVDALLQRARDYGQSRVVCGVHWQSDVEAGRLVGAAVVAQLHASQDFNEQLALARKEVAAARAAGAPAGDCAAETAALSRSR